MRKILVAAALAGAVLSGGIEVGARAAGLLDFPVFLADNEIGYIPAPSQSGSFMRSNSWAFNELSMGISEEFDPKPDVVDVLLIGDSVVYGGNPYRQPDRLGPQLALITGFQVWPISAGSWALQNELTWLKNNQAAVKKVDKIVFVLNGGDFSEASSWRSDLSHPRDRPNSAIGYLTLKYLLKSQPPPTPAELLVEGKDWRRQFAALAAQTDAPITVVLYPARDPDDVGEIGLGLELVGLGADRLVEISRDPRWDESLYRDGIHPTPAGNVVLAKIIAEAIH